MTIGAALKTWREGLEITQAEAAARAHVGQATWSDWEADKKTPSGFKAFDLESLTGGAVTAKACAEAARAARAARIARQDRPSDEAARKPTGTG